MVDEVELRIDNTDELKATLGEQLLEMTLEPVNYPDKMTLGEYWKTCHQGTFLLLTASARQPKYSGASVHCTILSQGVIKHASAALMEKRLVGVQRIVESHEAAN